MRLDGCVFGAPPEAFTGPSPLIAETRYFKAGLDTRDQRNPGRMVIHPRDHYSALTEWGAELWVEFGQFEAALERALKDSLDPDEPRKLINLECKMNLSDELRHTHWHMLPRYRNPLTIVDPETRESLTFRDEFYGRPYDFTAANYRRVSTSVLNLLIKAIQGKLDLSAVPEAALTPPAR